MSGFNLFHRFTKSKSNISNNIIQKDSYTEKAELENQINLKIIEIDKKIFENTKALIEAQIVKIRSNISKSNNFIEKIGHNIYKKKIDESINWHTTKVKELYLKRKALKIYAEKIKGIYWLNKIKRFLKLIMFIFFILLCLFLLISGFMIIIYLLPILILFFLGYLIVAKTD